MKSIFSFLFLCVLSCVKICCYETAKLPDSFVHGDDVSINRECLLRYLKNEKNLDIDVPMRDESPKCGLMWSDLTRSLRMDLKDFIERQMPNDENCATELLKSEKAVDLILTIIVVEIAHIFSEIEKKFHLTSFRNELELHLKKIANECQTPDDKFVSLFKRSFTNNETLIALETDYCMTMYVINNNILSVDNVDLNPKNIEINNLNCSFVMMHAINKDEKKFRSTITVRDASAIECTMNEYKENKLFDLDFAMIVLKKLKISSEAKSIEIVKNNKKRAIFAVPFYNCYMLDKDFRANPENH